MDQKSFISHLHNTGASLALRKPLCFEVYRSGHLCIWPHCYRLMTHMQGRKFHSADLFVVHPMSTKSQEHCSPRFKRPSQEIYLYLVLKMNSREGKEFKGVLGISSKLQRVLWWGEKLWTMWAILLESFLKMLLKTFVTLGRWRHSWSSMVYVKVTKLVFINWNTCLCTCGRGARVVK